MQEAVGSNPTTSTVTRGRREVMIINTLLILLGVALGVVGTLGFFRGNIWVTNWKNRKSTINRWQKNMGPVPPSRAVGRFAESNREIK